jgi:hypothetical protein
MNILFVTGHPAQIHNFRYIRIELEKKGHKVFWLASDKDFSKYLLDSYNINYTIIPKPGRGFFSKAGMLFKNTLFVIRFIKRNKIDLTFTRISPYASVACFLLSKTHFAFTDTESAGFYDKFFSRFVTVLFTAKSFNKQLRKDQIRLPGNKELFYLHPNRFTPVDNIHELLNIEKDQQYVIMRFVKWDAYHDKGLSGFSVENKLKAVEAFSEYAKVFISSEGLEQSTLSKYDLKIPPEKIHDVLSGAKLYFGESSTMATESAVLGTPAVFLNQNWFGSTSEAEKYGLLFSFKESPFDQINAINKGIELLQTQNLKENMILNKLDYLKDKIDVTAFMVWFIEYYPESFRIMKVDPEYHARFR